MEKSIESIWKQGFLKENALVAPRVNNLYNRKSGNLIERFNHMYKYNLIGLVVFGVGYLIYSFFNGSVWSGAGICILFVGYAYYNKKASSHFKEIDYGSSSFVFLQNYRNLIRKRINVLKKVNIVFYPACFICCFGGIIFNDNVFPDGWSKLPDLFYFHGVPVIWLSGIVLFFVLLVIFAGRITEFDIRLMYGRMMDKMDELIAEMESLN